MNDKCGYEANFVGEVPEHLKCSICCMVLRDAMQLADCGHRFCKVCLQRVAQHCRERNQQHSCPIDRGAIDERKVFEDKATQRLILNLKVVCHFDRSGCHWTGELRDLNTHVQRYCNGQKTKTAENQQIEQLQKELQLLKENHQQEVYRLRKRAVQVEGVILLTLAYVMGVYLCKHYIWWWSFLPGHTDIVSWVLLVVCWLGYAHLKQKKN